jgi:hypothetical protein
MCTWSWPTKERVMFKKLVEIVDSFKEGFEEGREEMTEILEKEGVQVPERIKRSNEKVEIPKWIRDSDEKVDFPEWMKK